MRITILDTETTLKSSRANKSSTPHDPNNQIVYLGHQDIHDGKQGKVVTTPMSPHYSLYVQRNLASIYKESDVLVGHNIRFDLHYMRNESNHLNNAHKDAVKRGMTIWDTQLAHYILTGQQDKMVSLDNLSAKFGLPLKDSKMKDYWECGISTEDIPEHEIVPYLLQDVTNTREIFLDQVQEAKKRGMLPLILTQMDALLATQEMEFNGMHVDNHVLLVATNTAKHKLLEVEKKLLAALPDLLDPEVLPVFNTNSNMHLAHLLFGESIDVVLKEDTGTKYKSGVRKGTTKYKNVKKSFKRPNYSGVTIARTPTGKVKVDAAIIKRVSINSTDRDVSYIATLLLEHSLLSKELNTYLNPIAELVWRHDECIHHSLNHTITSTGRLSSSEPNLQNVPHEGTCAVKDVYTSRYSGGSIIEVDYSQLEVVGLAHLTQDGQLMYDMSHGVDMHLENAATLFGCSKSKVDKEMRRQAKVGTFQLQYGAGATTISEQSGLTMAQAKALIDAYYTRYPTIKAYHSHVRNQVMLSRKPTKGFTDKGLPRGEGKYVSITGRQYVFREYDAPSWSTDDVSFSPTEMKNYPVQGFATADIVPLMLGKVLRNVMTKYDKVKMINTVHDSILFDAHPDVLDDFLRDVTAELSLTGEYLNKIFDINVEIPFPFDIELGSSWGNKKPLV
jgi:DNA polymerase I-like protein with 3'-5' exonuclease and polymerase domains